MSEMSLREAYRVMQEHCGIEEGDIVTPLFIFTPYALGYENGWTREHKEMIGKKYTVVRDDGNSGFALNSSSLLHFPCFALKLIEKAKPELPESVTFTKEGLKVGEVFLSKDTIKCNLRLEDK